VDYVDKTLGLRPSGITLGRGGKDAPLGAGRPRPMDSKNDPAGGGVIRIGARDRTGLVGGFRFLRPWRVRKEVPICSKKSARRSQN